jgi:hypothetical protein
MAHKKTIWVEWFAIRMKYINLIEKKKAQDSGP